LPDFAGISPVPGALGGVEDAESEVFSEAIGSGDPGASEARAGSPQSKKAAVQMASQAW